MSRRRWTTVALAVYFCFFLLVLYGPMILMAVLSLQGPFGNITFPLRGFGFGWWHSLFDSSLPPFHAREIRTAGERSLWVGLASGVLVTLLAFTLSMAFRRRFKLDGVFFYVVILALMTPGFLLSLGTALFWQFLDTQPDLWRTVLGTNVVWGLPFGFLVMLAVWNRYDRRVEEASRDLGAGTVRTFREITLPLIWTGLFGCFLFGFTLSWNEFDRSILFLTGENTLPVQIFALTTGATVRPDLYALGTATTLVSLLAIAILLIVAGIRLRVRGAPVHAVEEEFGLVASVAEPAAGGGGMGAPGD